VLARLRRSWSGLLSGYWFVPTVIVVIAAAVALVLLRVDEAFDDSDSRVGFTGGPDSARELLSAVSSSMLTLTALVFSVTVVVLQLASGQFSPRVLHTFLRDHRNQATLGVFLSTFVYALLVLRRVRGDDGAADQFVPGVAVSGAFVLAVVSIAFFVQYIHNIVSSIRVVEIIDRISRETARAIERTHPVDGLATAVDLQRGSGARDVVSASDRGALVAVDIAVLCDAARRRDAHLVVVPRVGDFVATGTALVEALDGRRPSDHDTIRRAFPLAKERDLAEDPAFGFRQLVDIAERALSPGVNDPTTACQCLDHLHDLLRRLLYRPLPSAVAHGDGRVVVPQYCWDDYLSLALDEIRHWGGDSLQIHRRMNVLLADLADDAPTERAASIGEQRQLLRSRQSDLPATERSVIDRGWPKA